MRGPRTVRDSPDAGGRALPIGRTGPDGFGDDRLVRLGERDLREREDNVVAFCLSGESTWERRFNRGGRRVGNTPF